MWVRGLKLERCRTVYRTIKSHPMWVRGLKLKSRIKEYSEVMVAPHVGAWIETLIGYTIYRLGCFVAPHVGAWIETRLLSDSGCKTRVAPHVGAWIETISLQALSKSGSVAPHVGAWIETNPHA